MAGNELWGAYRWKVVSSLRQKHRQKGAQKGAQKGIQKQNFCLNKGRIDINVMLHQARINTPFPTTYMIHIHNTVTISNSCLSCSLSIHFPI